MKIHTIVISIIIAMISISVLTMVSTSEYTNADPPTNGTCGDDLDWSYDTTTLTITGTGAMYDYVRSGGITTAPWSSYEGSMTAVIMPNGMTTIGDCAFYYFSKITSITFPDSLTSIGDRAFASCSGITGSLTLPEGVTTVKDYAFYGCTGLNGYLTLPTTLTTIGNNSFYNCDGLIGDLTIGNNVTSIGTNAFYDCEGFNGALTIGNSVTTIGDGAFYYCSGFTGALTIGDNVTTIGNNTFYRYGGYSDPLTIPENVNSIGTTAFIGCDGSGFNVNANNTTYTSENGLLLTKDRKTLISGLTGMTGSLTIPDSVTTISDFALYDCNGLTGSLEIPESVSSIGSSAFYGCGGFNGALVLSDNITTINSSTFASCTGLNGFLVIPESVVTIDDYAFYGCDGFSGALLLPDILTHIGNYAFYGCNGLNETLILPNTLDSVGDYAFGDCTGFTGSLVISNEMTVISAGTFDGCTGFDGSLFIPDSVITIGDYAFDNSRGFKNINIPDTVTSISGNAFTGVSFYNGSTPLTVNSTNLAGYSFSGTYSNMTRGTLPQYMVEVVSTSLTAGTTSGSGTYTSCNTIVITATAYAGHKFVQWSDGNTNPTRTVTVTSDCVYEAIFLHTYAVTVTASPSTGGSVFGGGSYDPNTVIEIVATPNEGYHFIQWNDGDTHPVRDVTVTSDITYTATFATDEDTVIVISSSEDAGTVSGGGTYEYGSTATIVATPNAGYAFSKWNDGDVHATRTITVTSAVTFVASFVPVKYTVTVVNTPADYGTVSGGGIYEYGSVVIISAIPNNGYRFVQWNDGDINSTRSIVVNSNITYTATFAANDDTLTVISSSEHEGTVSGGGTYPYGTPVTIVATPNDGYGFSKWNDGNTESTRIVTITVPTTFIAYFTPNIYTVSVVASPEDEGTVSGSGTYDFGTIVVISAVPDEGHHFSQWNDGDVNPIRAITVRSDVIYTATFDVSSSTNDNGDIIIIFSVVEILTIIAALGAVMYFRRN